MDRDRRDPALRATCLPRVRGKHALFSPAIKPWGHGRSSSYPARVPNMDSIRTPSPAAACSSTERCYGRMHSTAFVVMFLDQAEFRAQRRQDINMRDWAGFLDTFLHDTELPVLEAAGSVNGMTRTFWKETATARRTGTAMAKPMPQEPANHPRLSRL